MTEAVLEGTEKSLQMRVVNVRLNAIELERTLPIAGASARLFAVGVRITHCCFQMGTLR